MILALCCTVLALLAVPSHEQDDTLISPCPDTFMYLPQESKPGQWYGVVTLKSDIQLYSMWLNIVLDRQALNLGNWIGKTTTNNGINYRIHNENLEIGPNQTREVRFFIQYDPRHTIPKVQALRLNGLTICNVDDAQKVADQPNQPFISNSFVPLSTPTSSKPTLITPNVPVYHPETSVPNIPIVTGECGEIAGGNGGVLLINNGMFYDRGEIPWLVAIYRIIGTNLQFICGGTLVTDRHVITAAHCMYRRSVKTPIAEIVIKNGVHSLNDWSDDLTVISKVMAMTINDGYNSTTFENDILIFTLKKRLKFSQYIRPACLWGAETDLSRVVGASGVVAGWGARAPGDIAKIDEPQMVRVPIVSTKECRASKSDFHKLTYKTTLCAGDRNGSGPCTGDSGGGLYLLEGGKWRLRGIVSVSVPSENGGTCNLNEYVVFTDAAQFLPWIRTVLSEKYYD